MKSFLFAILLCAASPAFAVEDEDATPPPPVVSTRDTWLFSWTKRPAALENAKAHLASQLARAQDCLKKLDAANRADQEQEVAGCEGNEMAAGPGVYVCDNPFTSHDYGDTLLMLKAKPGINRVVNMSGLIPPASGGVDRAIAANANYGAILYDFRTNDDGGYAVALRDPALLDAAATTAVKVPAGERKEFHFHAPFKCKPDVTVPEVLSAWGDQLEFLALTYDTYRDQRQEGFTKNGALNEAGLIAALASNITAVPDDVLNQKIAALSAVAPEIKVALTPEEGCRDGEHLSPRMCLAYELYDSIVGNYGTERNPTQAWPFKLLKPALIKLGILDQATAAKLKTQPQLMSFLAKRFQRDASQTQRAEEAFGCVKALKSQLAPKGLASWTEAPAANTVSGPEAAVAPAGGTSAR